MNQLSTQAAAQPPVLAEAPQAGLAVRMAEAEMDKAIVTAKQYPRSIQAVHQNILSLATLDDDTAQDCVYALPRGGKPIKGPSVRLAEIIASQYGNCHVGSRIVDIDRFEKVIIAEGIFWDLETGMRRTNQVRRRISGKNGQLFNDDMINMTGNAAASIAVRNAILAGIPKALWKPAYDACEAVLAGNQKTLAESRAETFKAFAAFGVTPDMIFEKLEIDGEADMDLDAIGTLRAIYRQVHKGDETIEQHFKALRGDGKAKGDAKKSAKARMEDIAKDGDAKTEDKPNASGKADAKVKDGADADEKNDGAKNADDQPSDETPKDAEADAQDEAVDDDAQPDEAAQQEALENAHGRGVKAKKSGMARKAIPGELRDNPDLSAAWQAGWDEEQGRA